MHNPDMIETAACGSVRFHCRFLGLTNAEEAACIATVRKRLSEHESPAKAIGAAKQEAEKYARPAMRKNLNALQMQH